MNNGEEIIVVVNGKAHKIERGTSLALLLDKMNIPRNGTAVEIDGRLINASEFETHVLQPGQKIEIVRLVGGG